MRLNQEGQVNLAAIMFTDIAGYTSLTESDENLALKLLDEHRKIVRPLISTHGGKEVKTMGDAFLVEFTSAVKAARCAIEIQKSLREFNASRRAEEKILLRVGIHLGDVVHSERDVYGDAVNVASRIEGLSEPGGISVSRQVYDSVRNKLRDVKFESLGLRQLKNVSSDIEVFKIIIPREDGSFSAHDVPFEETQPKNRIAVLPFVNISSDPADEYFADGLTEELISRLSQARELRVIARTSSMNYKSDRQKKIRDIGRELGAGTLIEGSVRKAGSKIRVTVQIVNAVTEEHLWSSRYDRNLDDIFEIQTEIADRVAESFSSTLAPLIQKQIHESGKREETHDLAAYTYFLEGRHLLHGESEASVKQALEFFSRAIEEDPSFARAYVGRADSHLSLMEFAHTPFMEEARKAESDLKKALELGPNLAEAHASMSRAKYNLDEIAASEQEARRAVELNPSLADAYHALGHLKWIRGRVVESTELFETAYKLDPLKEENVMMLCDVYVDQGRDADALNLWNHIEHIYPQAAYSGMSFYYMMKRDYSKAAEFLEKYRGVPGHDAVFALSLEGAIAACKGEGGRALEIIRNIEQTVAENTLAKDLIGLIYCLLGDMDRFFESMNDALKIHALPLGMLVNSPIYAKARKDPRMRKLLEFYDFKIEFPED